MILRRVTLLDPVKLGASVSVFIQVTLEKQTEPVLDAFEAAMASFPEVMECYLMTGDSDYLLLSFLTPSPCNTSSSAGCRRRAGWPISAPVSR